MRAAISTELLWRLMNATPEQYAAVARILGVSAECEVRNAKSSTPHPGAINRSVRRTSSGLQPPSPQSGEGTSPIEAEREAMRAEEETLVSEEVARSAFALLQKLELDAPVKAPSVLTVFRLYCVDGHSADRVARKCRCAKGTVMSRLRFIEERTGVKAEQFRAMSGHLQQVDDDLNSSGAREIYRKGLVSDES